MPGPFFPLREGLIWSYSMVTPILSRLFLVHVEPEVEIEVEDLVTQEVRRERAWVLREEDAPGLTYLVEREEGALFLRERTIGQPAHKAIVVTEDLRWAGPPEWSRSTYHYSVGTVRCRRAGEEKVTVTAGRFDCLKILLDEGDTGTVWLAPGVGIVRSVGVIDGLPTDRYQVVELHTAPDDLRPRRKE